MAPLMFQSWLKSQTEMQKHMRSFMEKLRAVLSG
jgi:hypothetical protein